MMLSATAWQASILRLETITCAPLDANKRAIDSPIPRLAPVTKAILPVKSNKSFIIIPYILHILFIHFKCVAELEEIFAASEVQRTQQARKFLPVLRYLA